MSGAPGPAFLLRALMEAPMLDQLAAHPTLQTQRLSLRPLAPAAAPRLAERAKRRSAEGVQENLAARDQRDSQRADAPLMIPLGAVVINNSGLTPEQTSAMILERVRAGLGGGLRL